MTEQTASVGPSVKMPGGDTPQWWQDASPAQHQAWLRVDSELAEQLGTSRPYVHGPWVGSCPGSERGHGLTASSVHAGGCCGRWDEARAAALQEGRGEPTEIDRLMATDPPAARLAMAQQRLDAARSAGAYPQQIEQLEMRVRAAEAGAAAVHPEAAPTARPPALETGSRGERYLDTSASTPGWAPPAAMQRRAADERPGSVQGFLCGTPDARARRPGCRVRRRVCGCRSSAGHRQLR
jgi:hypothetical protein